jgi:ferredoxin
MKRLALGSKDRISRREFLRILRLKNNGMPIIDKEKCTGCGLCAINCPTEALTISQNSERDSYQLLFRHDLCDACGICEKSCPEHCLSLVENAPERDETEKEDKVIFEDRISRCRECGIPLFPMAMVNLLKSKISATGGAIFPFDLCPSCRIKIHVGGKRVTKK